VLTEQFLNSCFLLVLNKNIPPNGMNVVYRDIQEILGFYKKKEKGEIPIILKNKVDCLVEICDLRILGRAPENIIDSLVGYSNKFKDLESFMTAKCEQVVTQEIISDNVKQVNVRKKIMIIFADYDSISAFLDSVKEGTFNSTDEVTNEFEGIVKDLYSNLMKIKRAESVKGSSSLDLSEDSYDSVISLIKSKYHEELVTSGFPELDNVLRGGFQKGRLYIMGGGSGCVDKDTEFFNGTQWKKISEWNEHDLVLQYNEDGSANLVKPKRYIKTDCEEFNSVESKYGIDMMFCDYHNHVYVSEKNHNKPLKISTKELLERHDRTRCGFRGRFLTTFDYEGKGIDLSDNEIRLMVAVIADGYFRYGTKLVRVNIKKERKKERLIQLLHNCSIQYRRTERADGFSEFYFYAPLQHKEFKFDYWFNSNREQLKVITDECLLWDGDCKNTFFTTSKESADFIQFAFSATGKRSTISIDDRRGDEYKTYNKTYIRKSISYEVNVCGNNTVSFRDNNKKTINRVKSQDGKKYCFEVESGMLVLRRNNKIFCTGNSGKSTFLINILNRCIEEFGNKFKDKVEKDKSAVNDPKKVFIYITLENLIDESLMRMYQSMFDRSYDDLINLVISDSNTEIKQNISSKLDAANTTVIMKYFPKFSITPTDINMIIDDVASVYGKENIQAVLVDYLDLLEMDRIKYKSNDMYRLELSKITSALKDIAVEHNLPLITLTQLGRDVYGKSFDPKSLNLGLISEAIKKVEHADFVSLMVRDASDESKIYLYVGKNRGGKSNVHMIVDVELEKFKFLSMRVDKNNEKHATSDDNSYSAKPKNKKSSDFSELNAF